jgi:hypothetical protein
MAKKDINYIKFIKPQVKQAERDMRYTQRDKVMQHINETFNVTHTEVDTRQETVCKEAAQMGSKERLMNYAVTKDPTYLGVGCKWDLLTQMGRDMFGRFL